MDESTRNSILTVAEELFDSERLYKLASSVGEARSRKGLRYWQEQMLAELTQHCGIDVTKKTKFIAAFKGTKERYAPPKPDNSPAGVLKNMQTTWSDSVNMQQWVQWAARDLSKIGTLDSYVHCYRALAKFLTYEQVVALYTSLRDYSMRAESEWRHEFLRYFKKTLTDNDLPVAFDDDYWIEQCSDFVNTTGIDPATGMQIGTVERKPGDDQLEFEAMKRADEYWSGKERECPKCATAFKAMCDRGQCPNCYTFFHASHPDGNPDWWRESNVNQAESSDEPESSS